MVAKAISLLGTGTAVGKSLLATAFCRFFKNKGHKVAPFKAQNMSNNSYVAVGGEIGRAQAEQAWAAGVLPHVDHNPILLKPYSDTQSQVIVHGKVWKNFSAASYFNSATLNGVFRDFVVPSLERLMTAHDFVVLEGAGSCAEVNLLDMDIVNFRPSATANAKVILVADIDKGGVFAQVIGTLEVLPAQYRNQICGIIINKFRGDASLFDDGVRYIEARTNLPVLGVVPLLRDINIPCTADAKESILEAIAREERHKK